MAAVISDVWTYILVLIGALAIGWAAYATQEMRRWRDIAHAEADESYARLCRWMAATEQAKELEALVQRT